MDERNALFLCLTYLYKHPKRCKGLTWDMLAEIGAHHQFQVDQQ